MHLYCIGYGLVSIGKREPHQASQRWGIESEGVDLAENNNAEDALRLLSEFITGKKKYSAQPSALEKVMVKERC
jgi:hypothetical protein